MGKHSFTTEGSEYTERTYCEWCGLYIYWGNDTYAMQKERELNRQKHISCPNTPEDPTPPQKQRGQ